MKFLTINRREPANPGEYEDHNDRKGDKVSCSINNKVVGFVFHCSLFTVARLRFAHNTDATITDLKKTKAK